MTARRRCLQILAATALLPTLVLLPALALLPTPAARNHRPSAASMASSIPGSTLA